MAETDIRTTADKEGKKKHEIIGRMLALKQAMERRLQQDGVEHDVSEVGNVETYTSVVLQQEAGPDQEQLKIVRKKTVREGESLTIAINPFSQATQSPAREMEININPDYLYFSCLNSPLDGDPDRTAALADSVDNWEAVTQA